MNLRPVVKRSVQELCTRDPFRRLITWHGPRSSRSVAITFDDGPHPGYTERVLAVLADREMIATFFLLGDRVERYPKLVDQIIDAGHEVGIHGYDHSHEDLPGQTVKTAAILARHGVFTSLFRPPNGEITPSCLSWMVRHGYVTVMWSLDSYDAGRQMGWMQESVDYTNLKGGDVILFHDDNDICIDELPGLLDLISEQHLRTVSISELLGRGE